MGLSAKLFASFILMGLLLSFPAKASSATVEDISKDLICQCGCYMVLSNCDHPSCASRDAMIASIREEVAEGKSKAEIIQSFVQRYGDKVLAAPPKSGFGLTAWVLPFGTLVIGAGAIYALLRTWLTQSGRPQIEHETIVEEEDEKYVHRLEKELEEFTEQYFR